MSQQRQVLIRLFGSFEFLVDDAPQPLAIAGATKSLLQYLVCFPERQVRRDLLVEMFWGEIRFDRRRSALNSAIWRIRKALRLIRGVELDACTESVALHLSSNVERDVDQLASLLQILQTQGLGETDRSSALGRLKDSLARCGAPVLDGIDDDWAVIERDRFSELYVKGLTVMMRATAERRCYDDALDYGRQILCIDPFREAVFCEVMCLCMMSGQRVKAMRMYECFVVALDAELGIAPMAETRALYDHIKQDRPPEAPWCAEASEPLRRAKPGTLGDRLHQIEHARLALYRAMSTATH